MSTQPIKQSYLERMSYEMNQPLAGNYVTVGEPHPTPTVTEADLRASLAAIHYNACRPEWLNYKREAQMIAIRDECERCIPALKGLRP